MDLLFVLLGFLWIFRKKKNVSLALFLTFIYVLIDLCFVGKYSYVAQTELNDEIKKLNGVITSYKKKCASQKTVLKNLSKEDFIERFAREEYFMKKPDEEIFIIEINDRK